MLMLALRGSRLAERSRAEDTGLAPQESVIETLCSLAFELVVQGVSYFYQYS